MPSGATFRERKGREKEEGRERGREGEREREKEKERERESERESERERESICHKGCVIPDPQFRLEDVHSGPGRTLPVGPGTPGNPKKHGIPKKSKSVSNV